MGVSLTQQKILIGQKPLESRVYSAPDSTLSLKGSNALTWFPTTSTGMGFIGPVSNKFLSLFPASVHDVISCPYLQPKAPVEKTLSTPNSPLLTHRSSSLERSNIYTNQQQQQQKVLWHNLTTSDSVLCLRRRVLIVWISFFFADDAVAPKVGHEPRPRTSFHGRQTVPSTTAATATSLGQQPAGKLLLS